MYYRLPKTLHNIIKLFSGNIATKVIGIAVLTFYTRILTKEELAIFPIYMMLSDLSSLLFSFGIMPYMIKQLPFLFVNDAAEAKRLIASSGALIVSGTILVSVAVFFLSDLIAQLLFNGQLSGDLIRVMTIGFTALSVTKIANQILWASGRFGRKSAITVFDAVIRPCCTISLFLSFGIKGLVVGLVLAQCINATISIYFVKDVIFTGFNGFFSCKNLLKQALPFYLESYLMYFRREGDNWLVSTMLGPATLAVYYIAKTVYGSLFMIYSSVDQVITKNLANLKNEMQAFLRQATKAHSIISLYSIPAIFFVITLLPFAISLLAGEKYQDAFWPATFLLLALLVDFQRITNSRTIFIILNPIQRFKVTAVDTCTLLPALLFLGAAYGVTGVAAARFVSQTAGGIYGLLVVFKNVENFTFDFKMIMLQISICLLSTIAIFGLQGHLLQNSSFAIRVLSIIPVWAIVLTVFFYLSSIGYRKK